MAADSSERFVLLNRLVDEFAARYRQGERPSLQEYVDRHPELADDIRAFFPAMAEMEMVKDDRQNVPAPSATGPLPQQYLGDYRILREVGHGGMGVVYEAEQVSLGRHVALKVLPQKLLVDAGTRRRFEREARAAAKLHHTNIVPVFGVGEHDGLPYYVMQFIEGLGLDEVLEELKQLHSGDSGGVRPGRRTSGEQRISRRGVSAADVARSLLTGRLGLAADEAEAAPAAAPDVTIQHAAAAPVATPGAGRLSDTFSLSSSSVVLPGAGAARRPGERAPTYWQSVARVGVQVADALEHAHRQGIQHRDIKPSNLLLDTQGTVWVTDFGLAKADDQQDLTHTGDILGTLRYMPPEAFEGRTDPRSDVYSLGLTLYELLAFRPAFEERERNRLIKQVTTAEPPRLDRLNRELPRDLVTMVHKAIDKEPARRYQTATELAADLQRFLNDEPIQARRMNLRERGWRWCRRNPAIASLTAALVLLLVSATVASVLAAARFERTAANERAARQQADDARRARELNLADTYTSFGLAAGARDDPRQAVLWFANAARLAGDDHERADANRIRAAAWGRQTIQPVRAFVHPAEWIENNMAFHPSGRHLLTQGVHPANEETDCRLWDLEREEALPFPGNPGVVSAAAWDAKGERLAVGTPQGEVAICRFPSGEPLQHVPYAAHITRLLFSPDGRYCAVAAANQARVWDCRQAAFVTPELDHPMPVTTLAFHPQGELLATGCKDRTCRVFAVPAEKNTPLFTPVPHWSYRGRMQGRTPVPLLFVDEGRGLLTVDRDQVSWRDPRTGQILRVLASATPDIETSIADDKHLVLAVGSQVRIYDVASAKQVSPSLEHRAMQPVLSAAFSPDGRTLLTGSSDHTARLWSVPEGKPLGGPLTHPTSVSAVAFAGDGRHLATAQRGGLIRHWALPAGNPRDYRVPTGSNSFVRLSHDGRFLLPRGLSRDGELRSTQVVDLTTGQRVGSPLEAKGIILDAAFSPDGLQVAAAVSCAASREERSEVAHPGRAAQQPGQVLLWDWRAGQLRHEPLPMPSEPRMLDYSPDGRQLAVIGAKGELVVIDPATGKTLRRWQAHPPYLGNGGYINNGAVRFSPDSRSLLTFGTPANSVRVWDALTGRLRYELKHHDKCCGVQFSPDGRLVATAGYDNRVCVWELATGEPIASLPHPDWAHAALFSPDGEHMLTACRDGMARLWNWRAGRLVCPPFEHEHEVHVVAFTPDGRHVLSASDDGVLKIWEWRTGKPVCPPLALGGTGLSLAVAPDGKRVAVGGFMIELPVFHLDDRLALAPLEPDDLCLWGEIVSGQRIEAGGGVTNLTAEQWLQRWQAFRQQHPEKAALASNGG
jgi:WD40 repeat protein/serine/threonine protein kinase